MKRSNSRNIAKIFPQILTIEAYLVLKFEGSHIAAEIKQSFDEQKPAFKELLRSAYILPDINDTSCWNDLVPSPESQSNIYIETIGDIVGSISYQNMSDIINRIVAQLVRSGHVANLLCLGYSPRGMGLDSTSMHDHWDIDVQFANTIHQMVKTEPWRILVSKIGELALRRLFERPVFIPTINGSYLQISGVAASKLAYQMTANKNTGSQQGINKLKALIGDADSLSFSSSLKRSYSNQSATSSCSNVPSDIYMSGITQIQRGKIFYNLISFRNMLPSNHSLCRKSTEDLVFEIFEPIVNSLPWLREGFTIAPSLRSLVESMVKNYNQYNSNYSKNAMNRFCGSLEKKLTKPSTTQLTPELVQTDECGNKIDNLNELSLISRGKKKRKRGSRGGRQVRERSDSNPLKKSKRAKPHIVSSSENHFLQKSKPISYISIGDKLVENMMSNVTKDAIVSSSSGLQTQEEIEERDTQCISSSSQQPAVTSANEEKHSLASNIFSMLRKDTRNRLSDKSIPFKAKEASNDDFMESCPQIANQLDSGFHHHLNRKTLTNDKPTNQLKSTGIWHAGEEISTASTPRSAVSNYIKSICRYIFSIKDVWGSRHNLNKFLSRVDSFINLGRSETMSVSQLIQGMRPLDIPALNALQATLLQHEYFQIQGINDKERKEYCDIIISALFRALIYWSFSQVVIPLISSAFYVTEIEGKGLDVFYFKKSTWYKIVRETMPQFKGQFWPIIPSDNPIDGSLATEVNSAPMTRASSEGITSSRDIVFSRVTSLTVDSIVVEPSGKSQPPSLVPTQTSDTQSRVLPSSISIAANKPPSVFNATLATNKDRQKIDLIAWSKMVAANKISAEEKKDRESLLIPPPGPSAPRLNNPQQLPPPRQVTRGFQVKSKVENTSSALKEKLLQVPLVRFLPKKSTIRPITNLGLRSKSQRGFNGNKFNASSGGIEVVTNPQLYKSLHVLKSVYDSDESLRGFGAFGNDEIYRKFREFRSTIRDTESTTQTQKFYVAALDLEKCYDNVDTKVLYDLIRSILMGPAPAPAAATAASSSELSRSSTISASAQTNSAGVLDSKMDIHKYHVTHAISSMDRNVSKQIPYVTTSGNIIPFTEAGPAIAANYRNSIISDAVVSASITTTEIMTLLRAHLFNHTVKMPSKALDPSRKSQYCTQMRGIPQGSILSPILCNFYYGNVENTVFGDDEAKASLGLQGKSVIVRLMDDYIMLSTEKKCVEYFLRETFRSYKLFGGKVNPAKTKVNFDTIVDIDGERVHLHPIESAANCSTTSSRAGLGLGLEGSEEDFIIAWCGFHINCRSLEITPDLNRFIQRPLWSSVAVESTHSGAGLKKSIKSFFRMKCHAIILDENINSRGTVLQSLYHLHFLCASRTVAYLEKLQRMYRLFMRINHVLKCIREGILFGAHLIHTRTKRKIIRKLCFEDDDNDEEAAAEEGLNFGICPVTSKETIFLAWHAFSRVLRDSSWRNSGRNHILVLLMKRNLDKARDLVNEKMLSALVPQLNLKDPYPSFSVSSFG